MSSPVNIDPLDALHMAVVIHRTSFLEVPVDERGHAVHALTGCGRDVDALEVALEGGPSSMPRTACIRRADQNEKIKIPYRNGYEHFERTDESVQQCGVPVFRWTTKTRVAE